MKVWITKYALTQGIYETEVEDIGNGWFNEVTGARPWTERYNKRDLCLTKESAIARAGEMRLKKIASLEKQIDKIKKLNFEEMCE